MGYRVAIVGATGAVGQELLTLLQDRRFPIDELHLLASARSAGKQITHAGKTHTIVETTPDAFTGIDIAIFSAGGGTALDLAPEAVKRGCLVIDNSSAFRMEPDVPLVVPEINGEAVTRHRGIIANPNCSTAVALMGLYPLHREFGLVRFFASTYQAASGAGGAAMAELEAQTRAWAKGEPVEHREFPHPLLFNVLPHVDRFLDDGYTKEEHKMLHEGRKILDLPNLRASTTCVRVPVLRAHSIALHAEFERPVDVERARHAIAAFDGAELCDVPAENRYPLPLDFAGRVPCGVGRIRRDTAFDNGLALWVCGDQLWKGAALNAVQIAEEVDRRDCVAVAV